MKRTYVVDKNVDDGESDDDISGWDGTWVHGVDGSDDELTEATDDETGGEEDPAATVRSDDEQINDDCDDTDSSKDTRVHERLSDVSHLEEVCPVGF